MSIVSYLFIKRFQDTRVCFQTTQLGREVRKVCIRVAMKRRRRRSDTPPRRRHKVPAPSWVVFQKQWRRVRRLRKPHGAYGNSLLRRRTIIVDWVLHDHLVDLLIRNWVVARVLRHINRHPHPLVCLFYFFFVIGYYVDDDVQVCGDGKGQRRRRTERVLLALRVGRRHRAPRPANSHKNYRTCCRCSIRTWICSRLRLNKRNRRCSTYPGKMPIPS